VILNVIRVLTHSYPGSRNLCHHCFEKWLSVTSVPHHFSNQWWSIIHIIYQNNSQNFHIFIEKNLNWNVRLDSRDISLDGDELTIVEWCTYVASIFVTRAGVAPRGRLVRLQPNISRLSNPRSVFKPETRHILSPRNKESEETIFFRNFSETKEIRSFKVHQAWSVGHRPRQPFWIFSSG